MDAEQVKKRAGNIISILKKKGALVKKTYSAQFDPEVIEEYGLPDEAELSSDPGAAQTLSTAEQAELAALRAKYGKQ
jgi:hypothetical protein